MRSEDLARAERIGIFGGTFNPIHSGHLVMAEMAREAFLLDKVVFVPAFYPPHKKNLSLASEDARCEMIKLAVRGNASFIVDDFEVKRGGLSYSIDTARHIKELSPLDSKIYFIIGEDNYLDLDTWQSIDEITKMLSFIVVSRALKDKEKGRTGVKHKIKCHKMMMKIDISSSELRKRINKGKTIKYLVPDSIIKYISENRLYLT